MRRRWNPLAVCTVLAAAAFVLVVMLSIETTPPATGASTTYAQQPASDTGAGNLVAGVYLNYRLFDSLLEILVFSVAFRIAADDTIHLLGRFRRAVERGRCVRDALVESVQDAGPAILMTTVVVSAGFSLLMASQFEVLFLVGLMTVVSALSAVCADLFLIPSILGMGRRASVRGTRMPNQIREA